MLLGLLAGAIVPQARAEDETIIEFKDVEVGKTMPSWTAKDVVFEPAGKLTRSKAAPRIMFFPHLMTEKKGILSAMAAEAIPVQIRFPNGASKVTLSMWGSIGSAARSGGARQEWKSGGQSVARKSPQPRLAGGADPQLRAHRQGAADFVCPIQRRATGWLPGRRRSAIHAAWRRSIAISAPVATLSSICLFSQSENTTSRARPSFELFRFAKRGIDGTSESVRWLKLSVVSA